MRTRLAAGGSADGADETEGAGAGTDGGGTGVDGVIETADIEGDCEGDGDGDSFGVFTGVRDCTGLGGATIGAGDGEGDDLGMIFTEGWSSGLPISLLKDVFTEQDEMARADSAITI